MNNTNSTMLLTGGSHTSQQEAIFDQLNTKLSEIGSIYALKIDENGCGIIEGLNEDSDLVTVSKLILIPVSETKVVTANNYNECFVTITAFSNKQFLKEITLRANDILDKKILYKYWGLKDICSLTNTEYQETLKVFFELSKDIPSAIKYSFTGWDNDNTQFILANLKITDNAVEVVENSVATKLLGHDDMTAKECCEFINSIFLNITEKRDYSITILLYLFLSLMMTRFGEFSKTVPSFILGVIGASGSRKTSALMAMANPADMDTASFDDTIAAVKAIIKGNRCCCTIIDDLNNKNTKKQEICEKIIRMGGDKSTSSKKMVGGKVDSTEIACLNIFTGEEMPDLQSSSIPRVLILNFDSNTVDNNNLTILQNNNGKFIKSIIYLLQYIMKIDNFEKSFVDSVLRARVDIGRKLSHHNLHGRYVDMLAWMSTSWEFMQQYFSVNGVELADLYPEQLEKLVLSQHQKYNKDPANLFVSALFELDRSNQITKVTVDEFMNDKACDIIDEDEKWFVLSGTVYNKIIKHYKQRDIEFPCTEATLRKKLFEKGFLCVETNCNSKFTKERKTRKKTSKSGFYLFINTCKKNIVEGDENE